MAITLSASERTALENRQRIIRDGVKFELDSGTVGFWTGLGPLTYDGVTYQGVGQLAQASQVTQSGNLVAAGIELQLAGLDQKSGFTPGELYTDLEDEDTHGRNATMYRFYFDAASLSKVNADLKLVRQVFKGFFDRTERVESWASSNQQISTMLSAFLESRLLELNRTHMTRRTNEHQQSLFSGDLFFDQTPDMGEREIAWGRGDSSLPPGVTPGGGGGSRPNVDDRFFF